MPYFTTAQLGPRQSLTPEGFLVCHDVAIARTGTMLYAPGEVPVSAGKDGLVRIERTADEVFKPETLASFEGKAVTLDHPTEDVAPENWSTLAKGVAQNVRRGEGLDSDLIVADLLITDAAAIKSVRDGLREVSCGYDADYEEIEPGRGKQTRIFGNHIALVERGRCGYRCAIGDSMKKLKFIDKLRAAFQSHDEAAFETALTQTADEATTEETEEEKKKKEEAQKTTDALTAIGSRLDTIDSRLTTLETRDTAARAKDEETEEEKKKREEAEKGKTGDSAALLTEAQDVIARAEILSPGLHMPTFDAAAEPAKVRDAICGLKRKALSKAFTSDKTQDALKPLSTGVDIKTATCDAVSALFSGASEIVRQLNNAVQTTVTFDGGKTAAKVANSVMEINRRNAAFWARN